MSYHTIPYKYDTIPQHTICKAIKLLRITFPFILLFCHISNSSLGNNTVTRYVSVNDEDTSVTLIEI